MSNTDIICKGCGDKQSIYDTLSGYCMSCADKRVKAYDQLKEENKKLEEEIHTCNNELLDCWTQQEQLKVEKNEWKENTKSWRSIAQMLEIDKQVLKGIGSE